MSEKRTLLQKILLGLLAAMTVLFAVLTGVNRSQPLVQWGDSLLRPAEEGNAAVYTSAVYGRGCRQSGSGPTGRIRWWSSPSAAASARPAG